MLNLRNYQQDLVNKIEKAWAQYKNVLAVLPTGGGKTVILSHFAKRHEKVLICAHRFYIVAQISCTLAKFQIKHAIIASASTVAEIKKLHNFVDDAATVYVSSKDTLYKRDVSALALDLIIMDEAHHVTAENTWGRIADSAKKGLFLTATPERCDGKGLGRGFAGLADCLVEGVTTRHLIAEGFLSNYKLVGSKCLADFDKIRITATKEYNQQDVDQEFNKSAIIGDIVKTYQKYCDNKLAICFTTSKSSCDSLKMAFNAVNIAAETISADTPILDRALIMDRFKRKIIKVLINVDILGEGADVPEVECVILARPTLSLSVYLQQVGRCLRPAAGKEFGYILDHANNWTRHGLPDDTRFWTLEGKTKRAETTIRIKVCENVDCLLAYSRLEKCCPYCQSVPSYKSRKDPAHVEGDLTELTAEAIAEYRLKIQEKDNSAKVPFGMPLHARYALEKRRRERKEAQTELRQAIKNWLNAQNVNISKAYRLFYLTFSIDVLNAQLLKASDAKILTKKIIDNNI